MVDVVRSAEPEDEYSFDALELSDVFGQFADECDEPVITLWVRKQNGLIYTIKKATLEKDEDGDFCINLEIDG